MATARWSIWMIATGLVAVMIAALTVVFSDASGSHAAGHQHCFTDLEGDVHTLADEAADFPRADILEVCAEYEPAELRLALRVGEPTDPATDPSWQTGETIVVWGIRADAEGYGFPTGQVAFSTQDGDVRVVATWYDDATPVCDGTGSLDGTWYRASFDPRCLDVPSTIAFNAVFSYDDAPAADDAASVYADVAPEGMGREGEGRFGGALTRAGVAPPFERLAGRFAGPTRIDTAIAISRSEFPRGAEEVYLARQDSFPDALAAGSLKNGPILLVPSCGPLPQVVAREIERLDPLRVIALGGPAAICDPLLDEARDR